MQIFTIEFNLKNDEKIVIGDQCYRNDELLSKFILKSGKYQGIINMVDDDETIINTIEIYNILYERYDITFEKPDVSEIFFDSGVLAIAPESVFYNNLNEASEKFVENNKLFSVIDNAVLFDIGESADYTVEYGKIENEIVGIKIYIAILL